MRELGLGLCPLLLSSWTPCGVDLSRSSTCCHSLSEFFCVSAPWGLEGWAFLASSVPTGSYHLSTSSSAELVEPGGKEFYENIPFRILYSEDSCPLHVVHLWVCVLWPTSLMMTEQDTDL